MGASMSWGNFSEEQQLAGNAVSAVQKAVALQRRTGLKNEHAIETVADLFHLTPRRVRMWLYGEVISRPAKECRLIMHRWWAARDLEVARLRAIADHEEREMERERIALAQLELPLGSVAVESNQSVDRRAANALAHVARHRDRFAQAEAEYRRQRRGPLK